MEKTNLFTKNFTLLVLGQVSSLFGNFILRFALSMHILEVTGSAKVFASMLAIATIPTIILSPFGGVLADRVNRKKIMVVLDLLSGIAVGLTSIFLNDQNTIQVIGITMIMLSILGAFESPTVQASVPQMHEGNNLIKANSVVNQVVAISTLVAPLIGGALYSYLGLSPVLIVTTACFFITAFLECFIKLNNIEHDDSGSILKIISVDLKTSINYIFKEQHMIFRMLIIIAMVNILLVGVIVIGLPFFIRSILGLDPSYYAYLQSLLGLAAIVGSAMVGLIISRIKAKNIFWIIIVLGIGVLGVGLTFIFSISSFQKYMLIVFFSFLIQLFASMISVLILSIIQQNTPNKMIGKIMAYVSTIILCVQPIGQLVYGFLFDSMQSSLHIILIITSFITIVLALNSKLVFKKIGFQE